MSETPPPRPSGSSKTRSVLPYRPSFWQNIALSLGWAKLYESEKKIFKAFYLWNKIVDLLTNDPKKRIELPEDLVSEFKQFYYGPVGDGEPALYDLTPLKIDREKGAFRIGKPVQFRDAWAGHDPRSLYFYQGYSYPTVNKDGTIDREAMEITGEEYTNVVSQAYWWTRLRRLVQELTPLCAQIELIIGEAITEQGIEIALEDQDLALVGKSGEDTEEWSGE